MTYPAFVILDTREAVDRMFEQIRVVSDLSFLNVEDFGTILIEALSYRPALDANLDIFCEHISNQWEGEEKEIFYRASYELGQATLQQLIAFNLWDAQGILPYAFNRWQGADLVLGYTNHGTMVPISSI